jgi:hypothetical protein
MTAYEAVVGIALLAFLVAAGLYTYGLRRWWQDEKRRLR